MKKLALVSLLLLTLAAPAAYAERDHARGRRAGCAALVGAATILGLLTWSFWPSSAPAPVDEELPAIVVPVPPGEPAPIGDVTSINDRWNVSETLDEFLDGIATDFRVSDAQRSAWSAQLDPILRAAGYDPREYKPREDLLGRALVVAGIRLSGQSTDLASLVNALGARQVPGQPEPSPEEIRQALADVLRGQN